MMPVSYTNFPNYYGVYIYFHNEGYDDLINHKTESDHMEEAVIVTGGSRRIGKRISQTLASNGFFVIIHYNSSSREADSLASTIETKAGKPKFECDLSKVKMLRH